MSTKIQIDISDDNVDWVSFVAEDNKSVLILVDEDVEFGAVVSLEELTAAVEALRNYSFPDKAPDEELETIIGLYEDTDEDEDEEDEDEDEDETY